MCAYMFTYIHTYVHISQMTTYFSWKGEKMLYILLYNVISLKEKKKIHRTTKHILV